MEQYQKSNLVYKLKYDGSVMLATGKNKKETQWKNKNMLYSVLIEKLSVTTRTRETFAEYKKMSKNDRDNIKDVGGFVGGSLKNGRRKAENVQNRSLLTLDLDYVNGDIWASIELLFNFSCLIYSTHSHAPDNQRLRLVIPLSRPVLPDEYQAIGRMIADDLGIDQFDDTTYEPSRLMFWPSTSCDGDYVFKVQDLSWLNPDEVLSRYTFGWQDISYWPESSRARAKLNSAIKRQEDPLLKRGIIGAFCRTYLIQEAISEFLTEVYTPGTDETRYTYAEGSTAGGLVVYEDKFTFSHHGTDPTSGILCNAFDLVRIHKFGELDDEVSTELPANRFPSFIKMSELVKEDNKVKVQLGRDRLIEAKEEFDLVEDDAPETDWMKKLELGGKGEVKSTISNVKTIITNDPNLKGKIAFDEFRYRTMAKKKLPWHTENFSKFKLWDDSDDAGLRNYLEKIYGIVQKNKIDDGLKLAEVENSFHPVKEYLKGLTWDGVERIETIFSDYLGAYDTKLNQAFSRKMFAGSVKRIFIPGCKYDYALVLNGEQGKGKSKLLDTLGKEWYTTLADVRGKEALSNLRGFWIVELEEMSATKKADVEAVKQFITTRVDNYREAYARRTTQFPRQCTFWGSTNEYEYLRDTTGNRRFWTVDILMQDVTKSIDDDLTESEVDQIWAEAMYLYKQGEKLWLNEEETLEAEKLQELHRDEPMMAGKVYEYLDMLLPEGWDDMNVYQRRDYIDEYNPNIINALPKDKVCALEIWVEVYGESGRTIPPIQKKEIVGILENASGWERCKSNKAGKLKFGKYYGQQRAFVRK